MFLPFLSSFFPHKLLFRTRSWFFEGEESKKSLGVKVTSKRIPGHFLKGFEARSAKEKEKCMRAAVGEQIWGVPLEIMYFLHRVCEGQERDK